MPKIIADKIAGLRPYQHIGVKFLHSQRRAMLCDEMGLGKSNSRDTPVLTPAGWTPIGDLRIGDRVIAVDGSTSKITGVFPQGVRELVRVTFSDGAFVDCDWDHLWEVNTATREHRGNPGLVMTTRGIYAKGLKYAHGGHKWRIPLVLPIRFDEPKDPLTVDPYTLGVLLGDGSFGQSIGLCTDHEIIKSLILPEGCALGNVRFEKPNALYNARTSIKGARGVIKELGLINCLAHQKFVPERYLYAQRGVRLALLQGLFDTDGTPTTARGKACTSVEYGTISKQLAEHVQFLVESIGGVATIAEKIPTHQGGEGQLYYRMVIRMPMQAQPFRLQRKLSKWSWRVREPIRCITSIEPIGEGEAVCIRVDHPRRLYVTRRCVVTHNSAQLIGASQGDTLIIAPANVIDTGTWKREIAKWATDPSRFTQCPYSRVSTRDGSRPTLILDPEIDRPWDTVILDEAHYIKNPKAKRTQVIRKLAKTTDRLYLATGSPIPNWPHEIFTSLQLIWPEKAKAGQELGSYWRWVEDWFKTTPSRYSQFGVDIQGLLLCSPRCADRSIFDPCEHYQLFVSHNFGPKFLQRLRDDVLADLPPLTEDVIPVPFTVTQEREYKKMAKDYIANVGDEEIVAWSDGAKNTMLDRMTTGLGLIRSPFSIKDSGKLELLHDDLSERYRPTVVVGHYRSTVEACAKVARDLGKTARVLHGETPKAERESIVEDFQAGRLDVLCGSVETIAEGLTLTAADMTIMVEYSWKPHRNQQVIRRIHRLGQDKPCSIRYYEARTRRGGSTLDTHKRAVVLAKTQIQQRVIYAAQLKQMLLDK